ncbi:MAG: hypothetical protein OEW83_04685 [Acidimicrobiia bacterium]|nr:hypothetical protein [Acidimicrobiia bacterium]
MSRLRRVAHIEGRRREQAGAQLFDARQELVRYHEQIRSMMAPTAERKPQSGAAMLAHRQAAGRMVERLVEATQAQRAVVSSAEEHFAETDKRAKQMARAVEIEDERLAADRRRATERVMEDTVIAVTAGRRSRPQPHRQPRGMR